MWVSFSALRRVSVVHVAALLAGGSAHAQAALPTLEALASAWEGSAAAPQCVTERATPGLPVVSELCVWRHSRESWAPYELGGHRRSGHSLGELSWYRSVRDSTAALTFRDSLDRALGAFPLRAQECPGHARFWQAPGLYIHFTIGGRQPSGRLNVLVTATTFPMPVITHLICPGAPIVPPSAAVLRSRIGAVERVRKVWPFAGSG